MSTATATPTLSRGLVSSLKKEDSTAVPAGLTTPQYDPSLLKAGILHLGVGNFHRSHLATYMNDMFNDPSLFEANQEWGIVGAGILSFDADKRKLLQGQDWMQTLVERDATSEKASILASMIDFLPVDHEKREHKALQDMLSCNAGIKIVSLTVTEGGYFLDNDHFNKAHPQIQHDIENPDAPQTIFGMMVKALKHRRDAGMKPFTIMSCDNIPHNGHVVQSVVLGIAQEQADSATLVDWIKENVTFPNSMVDRITPGSTPAMREHVEKVYGYNDASPIFCEPFRQWTVQDSFCQGRPDWDKLTSGNANISFVDDVAPYELMKIRILNGGHASLCYPAALLGVGYVHEAVEHAVIGPFLDALECNEIIPTVPAVPDGTSLTDYWSLIHTRFANPTILDTISRICYDGASRQPKFIVPVAADALKANGEDASVYGLALVSALWCRYCQGTTESGETIPANDPEWDRLQSLAQQAKTEPSVWLTGLPEVYGDDVGKSSIFSAAFTKALTSIQNDGVEFTLKAFSA
eukprot:CAMPEP_0172451640 /NCGR_PEP_ID=MMETSP1065-20121228/9592_1 /TAXON_ID=265537 /ORGANISM="Amphiprora paludosa, Strain CCMP125" /LENGTH=522 /DNA_ID=CAMNT_0013203603 /DNA_START=90 /DNA_END=1658 /DNA_ORIENTATION=+